MDQLELVFWLLVRLQFMYFQYNVYLSIVVRTNIVFFLYIYTQVIQNNLRTPQLAGFACQLGCKNTSADVAKVLQEFKQNQNEQDKLLKLFLEHWRPMMDIVEDISKMQGVPLYPDDDDGVWYNVTPEGVTLYHTRG